MERAISPRNPVQEASYRQSGARSKRASRGRGGAEKKGASCPGLRNLRVESELPDRRSPEVKSEPEQSRNPVQQAS